ncbi:endonuclease V isoform X4 [Phyllobates terribilis]|uniref:endonuclease V isoform X4 n=1 Tax=Phyllobates terribilis TaxID=111132 RepID=UPI003CCAFD5C
MEAAEDPGDETEREEKLLEWERQQSILKESVITSNTEPWQNSPDFHGLKHIGGVDLSYLKEDDTSACASLIVLSYPDLEVIYEDCQMVTLDAPYIAGFLAFREVPSLVEAVRRLQEKDAGLMPQVLFVDGNGILHHRGFGVACHLGTLTGLPTIGVAKNLLQVDGLENNESHKAQAKELQNGGDFFYLKGSTGNVLGAALKSSQKSVKPIYISVGHKISLETAVPLVHSCCRYRVPEPTRQDNDPKHTSRLCKRYLTKEESDGVLRQMTWPPQSPDLNPIEMVWGELDRRVKAKGPTSAKHLWELLQDC